MGGFYFAFLIKNATINLAPQKKYPKSFLQFFCLGFIFA